MAAFTLDIKGQLNNMRLSESKALWPLFEAVVNAIQAIEDSPNSKNGKITIFAQREMTGQENMSPQETLERFESFSITDNGIGMNAVNYKSFNTAYSTLKLRNYQFTISQRTADNLEAAMEQGNNILSFLKSEGYFEIKAGTKCKSTDFYKVYVRWCQDNLEKPFAAATFIHHLRDHQKSLGIIYDDKCIGTDRGVHNVDLNSFVPIDTSCPWD